MEKYSPNTKEKEGGGISDTELDALKALIGEKGSEGDVRQSVMQLKRLIADAPVTGLTLENRSSGVSDFVIPFISQENKEEIDECLSAINIVPWEESGHFVIERPEDMQKLRAAGIFHTKEVLTPITPLFESIPIDFARFPYHPLMGDESIFPPNKGKVKESAGTAPSKSKEKDLFAKEGGLDTEIQKIVYDFYQGILDEEDPVFKDTFGSVPDLKLFPHRYLWSRGVSIDKKTGKEITREDEARLLVSAKGGDQNAMRQVIEMHIGLLLYKMAVVRKRQRSVESDDLFQVGVMGIMNAVKKFDPEHEKNIKFSSYAGIDMESRMRRLIADRGRQIRLPAHLQVERNKYFRARNEILSENPLLREDDPAFRERLKAKLLVANLLNEEDDNRKDVLAELRQRLHIDTAMVSWDEVGDVGMHEVDAMGDDRVQGSDVVEDVIANAELHEKIEDLISALPTGIRSKIVLLARFGIIPETKGRRLFNELYAAMRANQRVPENSRRIMEEVLHFDPKNFDPLTFQEKPLMEQFIYVLSGKVKKDEFQKIEGDKVRDEATLEMIANFFGVTRERIRSIETQGLYRLRHPSRARKLKSFDSPD